MERDRSAGVEEAHSLGQPDGTGFTRPRPGVSLQGVGFDDVYKAERARLLRFVRSLGADEREADDAVQEAFIAAYQAWDTIREPRAWRAWLHTTAMRQYYRADARNRETPASGRMPDQAEPLGSDDIAEFNDLDERIRAAIAALPVRQRQVMALTMAGFKPAEIARQLGSDEAAVRQNKVRGRGNIARQLGIERRNPQ
jgi:RNA polymerase sigma factor (sigma-70 family)